MKVVKKIPHYPNEEVERNKKIAYDKLVLGMSNAEMTKKWNLPYSRLYQIWKLYDVVE